VNGGGLGYQKRPWVGRTLGVIIHSKLGVNVILRCSRAGERGENDAMRKGQSPDLERGKKSRRVCGGRHLSLEMSWGRNLVIEEIGSEVLAHCQPPTSYTLQILRIGEHISLVLASSPYYD
jgi:hypothetical protein